MNNAANFIDRMNGVTLFTNSRTITNVSPGVIRNSGTSAGLVKAWQERHGATITGQFEKRNAKGHPMPEPHELTKQEYLNVQASHIDDHANSPLPKPTAIGAYIDYKKEKKDRAQAKITAQETRDGKNDTQNFMHKALVAKAIEKGKEVHPAVLADYPDLKK